MAAYLVFGIALPGLIPLLLAVWKRHRIRKLLTEGDSVTGKILQVTTHRGHKGSVYYRAFIEYPVFDRAPIQTSYAFVGKKNLQKFYEGRDLEICYSKEKPERFIPREAAHYSGILIFGIVFAIIITTLCVFLYYSVKSYT